MPVHSSRKQIVPGQSPYRTKNWSREAYELAKDARGGQCVRLKHAYPCTTRRQKCLILGKFTKLVTEKMLIPLFISGVFCVYG